MALAVPTVARATPFDSFDESTFNDIDLAGHEVKYTSGAPFTRTVQFNNQGFGFDQNERGGATDLTGCQTSAGVFAFGARTAWVRFVSGVVGSLKIDATAGFDVIAWERAGPLRVPGSTNFTELGGADCIDSTAPRINGERLGPDRVSADSVTHVEIATYCGSGPDLNTACPIGTADASTGGAVSLKLTFTPDDQDADGVADTLDACPTVKGTAADGCLDGDGDGVSDFVDQCPTVKGDNAIGCVKADADRDGFRTDTAPIDCNDGDASIFPGALEVIGNGHDDDCDGVSAVDNDGDGFAALPAGKDCDDRNPAISPTAKEIRGNTVDEDCHGGAAPYLRVGRDVVLDYRYFRDTARHRVGFFAPRVVKRPRGPLPVGLIVDLRCQGTGCRFGSRSYRPKLGASALALPLLDRARLGDGTRVEVRMVVPGRIGRVLVYVMHWRAKPTPKELCLPPGADRPKPC